MSLIVRPLQPADALAVATLHIQTWLDTYHGLLPDSQLNGLNLERSHANWQRSLSDSTQPKSLQSVGAFREGELLGFASAGQPREVWGYDSELWAINVPSRFQKMGVGYVLMKACVQHCLQQNARNMYLYCVIGNDNAMQFYHRFGAIESERIKVCEGYRERALVWDDLHALSRALQS
ncbi:MAG TPA: GNAT family N-acetyltransferase [Oligoflexus sp.]|uniref:GNAT family N-acetyltransferase n=1 Tax=Oligoflexus sp. TaxID=1971216 RepID=UPI002D6777B3|nr:GNAT family N-acetyltransferase [Oligoflexus sp.]HYX37083.1 GNAT family N-acetyltransferase [Oligoflexus sp.]